jgi:hypothetical protein
MSVDKEEQKLLLPRALSKEGSTGARRSLMACATLAGAAALVGHASLTTMATRRASGGGGIGRGDGAGLQQRQATQMLLRHKWNGNEDYWSETPLDLSSNELRFSRHAPQPGFRTWVGEIENPDSRKIERENGIIVDSFGPAEAVASSRPEPDHEFNVRQIDDSFDESANARNAAARHSGGVEPMPPREMHSDQFVGEHVSTSGVAPYASSEETIMGARGEDEYVPAHEASSGMYLGGKAGDGGGDIGSPKTHTSYPRPHGKHTEAYVKAHTPDPTPHPAPAQTPAATPGEYDSF